MSAFFDFIKWLIKLSLAAAAVVIAVIVAFILGIVSKRRAKKEETE
jgi:ABC-type dipeptide/oligopeptide/nickel transport system permease component